MSYQFFHIETYGQTSSKKSKKSMQPTCADVLNEAMRVPGYCSHVAAPERGTPICTQIPLERIDAEITRRREGSCDSLGRKIRRDALCLLSGVASWPVKCEELRESDEEGDLAYKFAVAVANFVQERFSDSLLCAIVHTDEEYFHVHFYCVPPMGKGCFNMESIHPGVRAREQAERQWRRIKEGKEKKSADILSPAEAYKKAMVKLQDDFFEKVGQPFGLERDGPRRPRLERKDWMAYRNKQEELQREIERLQKHDSHDSKEIEALKQRIERMALKRGTDDNSPVVEL